jgi:hypothetical protein
MFKKLAKSGLVEFRLVQPQRIAPGQNEARFSNDPHSNDNLPGFRHPAVAGKRGFPTPALACHWFIRDGQLKCCWLLETDDTPTSDFDERPPGRACGLPPVQPRDLALVG